MFELLLKVPRKMWEHKFKSVIVLLFLYLGKKAWNIYTTWIRPVLDIASSMKGDPKVPEKIKTTQVAKEESEESEEY
jgi:hypothetical protein